MRTLIADKGSGDGVQAMLIGHSMDLSSNSPVLNKEEAELVLVVAKQDSVWKTSDAEGSGSFMPAGMAYHVWIREGSYIVLVSGELNISW